MKLVFKNRMKIDKKLLVLYQGAWL